MANKIKKTLFMLRKFYIDIKRDKDIYKLADDFHSPTLGEYYFIITEDMMLSGHSQQFHFDKNGIPIIPSYIDVKEQKMLYYPISIGQYGLAIWNTYLKTKSKKDMERFLKIADWFLENRIDNEKLGAYWLTDVDKPAYGIHKPWKSAFSQARAINIMMRAFQITKNKEYEKYSEKALYPFLYSIKDGGITCFTNEGPVYEEYPAEVPVLVLNGIIFALCGVYDFLRTHKDHQAAQKIYDSGVETLKKILPKYDLDFWSKYSLCQANFHPEVDPSTIGYHYLHIVQLNFMYRLTGEKIFLDYSQKWGKYVNVWNILKMYRLKYKALKKMNRL